MLLVNKHYFIYSSHITLQEMFREFADSDQKTRNDLEFRRKQRDVESRINQSMAHEDRERELDHRQVSITGANL